MEGEHRYVGWSRCPWAAAWEEVCGSDSEERCAELLASFPSRPGESRVVLPAGHTLAARREAA